MDTLLQEVTQQLAQRGETITCAESCTGGLLAAALTRLPGSSAWFQTGFVTYSNHAKQQLLNVNAATLSHYGAVSEETVREMALGALIATKADYAISISGIAGPGGGSAEKPVGTVCFGLACREGASARTAHFCGTRSEIRRQAADFAIAWLAQTLAQRQG